MRKEVLLGVLTALLVAGLLSPFASSHPDGLERVAEDWGFAGKAFSMLTVPIPDYLMPGVAAEGLATALAGIVGVGITFGVAYLVGGLVARGKSKGGAR